MSFWQVLSEKGASVTPLQFVEALPTSARDLLRVGGSGDGYVESGLEIRLETWSAYFRATRFRDGWIDFGFGQSAIEAPNTAIVEVLETFSAGQQRLLDAIPQALFHVIPMLRDSFAGSQWESVFGDLQRPADLVRVITPNAIHANSVSPTRWLMGATFFSDWETDLGFLFQNDEVIAVGEADLAETVWAARAAAAGTLTLKDAYWLAQA